MSRRCDITGKGVLSGNLVSHSNIKTRRRFLPNIKSYKFNIYGKEYNLDLSVRTLKSIEKNGGLDSYLLKTANSKLTALAKKIKKEIIKAQSKAA